MIDHPPPPLGPLVDAVNRHDLDAMAACFSDTYENETPVHPSRGFRGRAQVRQNWQRIFDGVPDVRADVVRATVDGPVVWSEWEMSGTRRDGVPHLMRGVIIFGVAAVLPGAGRPVRRHGA